MRLTFRDVGNYPHWARSCIMPYIKSSKYDRCRIDCVESLVQSFVGVAGPATIISCLFYTFQAARNCQTFIVRYLLTNMEQRKVIKEKGRNKYHLCNRFTDSLISSIAVISEPVADAMHGR